MKDRLDIEQVIRILGLNIRADQADGGADFDVACNIARKKLWKVKEYEDLEEQGKLLKLPCAVGDTVYVKMQFDGYAEAEVRDYSFFLSCGFCVVLTSDKFDKQHIPFTEFGKTVFLTKEEVETALNNAQ